MCYTIVTGRGRGRHARGRNRAADFLVLSMHDQRRRKPFFHPLRFRHIGAVFTLHSPI